MGKMASVARGKSGGSFSLSTDSAAKSKAGLASFAHSGDSKSLRMASEARGGVESVPSALKGAGKEGEQGLSMDMQSVPKPNSEHPNRPEEGSKKPAIQ